MQQRRARTPGGGWAGEAKRAERAGLSHGVSGLRSRLNTSLPDRPALSGTGRAPRPHSAPGLLGLASVRQSRSTDCTLTRRGTSAPCLRPSLAHAPAPARMCGELPACGRRTTRCSQIEPAAGELAHPATVLPAGPPNEPRSTLSTETLMPEGAQWGCSTANGPLDKVPCGRFVV